jgi:hypothetical protein
VIALLRDADPVPRNRWSETAEGRVTRDRAFDQPIALIPKRRRALAALVAAAVVLAIVAAVLVVTRGSERNSPASSDFAHGTWDVLVAGPATGMDSATAIWTGKELILWGRNAVGAQVIAPEPAAYNPRTGYWRRLNPPVSPSIQPVWTGREMIVWTGIGPTDFGLGGAVPGASYDPVSDSWRTISAAPVQPTQGSTAVWTGRQVIVVGAVPKCNDTANCPIDPVAAAAYDPSTDAWHVLPNSPMPMSDLHVGWTGRQVIAWGFHAGAPVANTFDPATNTWLDVPPPALALGGSAVVPLRDGPLWIGMQGSFPSSSPLPQGVIVRALSFGAQVGWRERARVLREESICPVQARKVGSTVVVLCAPGDRSAALDLATGRWRTIPPPPRLSGQIVWTGRELLALSADGKRLLRYRAGR